MRLKIKSTQRVVSVVSLFGGSAFIYEIFLLQNRTKTKMEKIAFCVITFDPIKIQTHSAPQNDRLNFSFVKDIHVDGGNLA